MPTANPGHRLELLFLGGFDARLDGQPIAGFSYNKMRALLAYLAVERQQDYSREVLADLLWSGNDPVTGRGNLRRTLADLRRVLGTTLFATSKHAIRFIPNAYIDVMDFTRQLPADGGTAQSNAERAVALYRGELLAGLSLPDSPVFEGWLQARRGARMPIVGSCVFMPYRAGRARRLPSTTSAATC